MTQVSINIGRNAFTLHSIVVRYSFNIETMLHYNILMRVDYHFNFVIKYEKKTPFVTVSIELAFLFYSLTGFLFCVLVHWSMNIGVEIYLKNGWCQIFLYLTYVSCFLSVW